MGDEAIPFLGGKVRVAISKSGTKMIFECAYHTFCSVVTVGVRGKLEVNIVFAEGFCMVWEHSLLRIWRVGMNHDGVGVCGRLSRL